MSSNVLNYQPIMERESLQLSWEYLTQADNWYVSNNRLAHRCIKYVATGLMKFDYEYGIR